MNGGVGGLEELSALYRIMAPGASHPDTPRVISDVLSAVASVIPCERPLVLIYNKESDEMMMFSPDDGMGSPISMAEPSILRRIFQTGHGEVVNELVADPDHSPALAELMSARELVGAPLDVAGERFGVVAAVNSSLGTFSEGDLRLLTVVADRAALTIANAQLKSTVQRQSQELEGLHRLSRLFTETETVEHVIAESVRIVCDLLDCEKVAMFLHDEEEDVLVAQPQAIGIDEDVVRRLRFSIAKPSLVTTVHRTDAPLLSNDARGDQWVDEHLRDLVGVQTVLVTPLRSAGTPLGALVAINAHKAFFDEGDVRFATLLGARIGSVIESSRARERERALVQRLREADQTKSEFVSMLTHELKGPMTAIRGFGEVLEAQWQSLSDAKRSHTLRIMSKEIGRLSRLVNDLLDLSRMEAGTLRYDFQPVSVVELIDNILSVHPSVTEQHQIEVPISTELPKVLADADRLRQVVLNLMTNATRHSPEGTKITVEAHAVEDQGSPFVVISVEDRGIGISFEDRERIFTKFATLPKPGWIKKGTGLGLYITKGIVEAHGGRLWVDSEPGKGSTFYFTLRLAEDSA